jgi:hypothetical protein
MSVLHFQCEYHKKQQFEKAKIPECEMLVFVEVLTEGGNGGSGLSGGFLPENDTVCGVESFSMEVVFEESSLSNTNQKMLKKEFDRNIC